MKLATLLAAGALMTALSLSGAAFAETDHGAGKDGAKAWKHEHHHEGLWELLPDDKRAVLHDAMKKAREDNKPIIEQMRKQHEELDAMMKAPDFNTDAYMRKSAELDATREKLHQNMERAKASVAAQFSPQERRVLLVMEHMRMHRHGGWQHHHGEGMKPDHGGEANQPS